MFEHSIKVPRLYKNAAQIAKEVSEGRGSIKQLVYESKHRNIKGLYALIVHTFQKSLEIEKLLKKSKLLIKEPRFNPWLAKILIAELLWGKKCLAGEAKPIKTILAYEQIFKAHLSDDTAEDSQVTTQVDKPRYVRVNTLKITVNEAVDRFREEGWILKRYTNSNYQDFIDAVANLGSEEFMVDIHIPYLLIFPPKTQFYQHPAYKNGNIILQDKASCLPVHLLNPEPGSTVLDMCAAPGMKTSHCAAVLEDKGKIFAVEIGKKRFETLTKIINQSGATCVEAINRDVLTLTSQDCPSVQYILVDPSCSGSGITDRVEIGQQQMEQHQNRIQKLAAFQITMLRYALTRFAKAKRVVYSTCSVYPEENEDVVRQVLETCRYFKLVPASPFVEDKWQNFGSSDFGDIGNYCLYAKPDIDLTSGFFVAVFERLEEGDSNKFLNNRVMEFGKERRGKKHKREEEVGEADNEKKSMREELDFEKEDKKKEVKGELYLEGSGSLGTLGVNERRNNSELGLDLKIKEEIDFEMVHKKKKKKNEYEVESTGTEEENGVHQVKKETKNVLHDDQPLETNLHKKKKKKKDKNNLDTAIRVEKDVSESKKDGVKNEDKNVVEDYLPLEHGVHKKKKKKKEKDRIEENLTLPDEAIKIEKETKKEMKNHAEEGRKFKKNKNEYQNLTKKADESAQDMEEVENFLQKRKKKRKDENEKFGNESEAEKKLNDIELPEENLLTKIKKKKKNKHKTENSEDYSEEVRGSEERTEKKKHKKKKSKIADC